MASKHRPLNPLLLRRIERSGKTKSRLAFAAGFPHYITFYLALRDEKIVATPTLVSRLERLADLVGFPKDEIFLDEATQ